MKNKQAKALAYFTGKVSGVSDGLEQGIRRLKEYLRSIKKLKPRQTDREAGVKCSIGILQHELRRNNKDLKR